MTRKTAADFSPELLDLYDKYVHDRITRREFLERAKHFTVAGMTAAAVLEAMSPDYALAKQVDENDKRIDAKYVTYDSPKGHGKVKAYMVTPKPEHQVSAGAQDKKLPGVLVVHENRGLNPYIEDVARRLATAGFLALAPDALTSLGGYPGNDDEGKVMQRKLDRDKITEDFITSAKYLHDQPNCSGKVGVVGFCFGGGMANTLAVRIPDIIDAAVPYYGRQAAAEDVSNIKAALLIHYAENDPRINEGAKEYAAALKKEGVNFTEHWYPGVNHGFHNDTTPRYDEKSAELSWSRTIAFFNEHLKGHATTQPSTQPSTHPSR